jgi:carbamoyltransferase
MNILGINAVYHESSAALLVEGKIVAACEEERFNRVKHGKQARFYNPHELPEQAIHFCLDHAGLRASEIDRVAYSFDPQIRRAQFDRDWWPDPQMEPQFLRYLGEVGDVAGKILQRKLGRALKFVPHHFAHAASAYYPSGFDPAAILVIDGIGEAACSTLARGEGARIETIETFSYPHSLGFLWEQASIHLGFSMYDAAKVMGLAAYGNPDVYREHLASIIQVSEDSYAVDRGALASSDPHGFEPLFGPNRKEDEEILPRHMDFAAALQEVTDAAVVALLRRLERSVKADRLCVAGGVALNCVTNELIRKATSYSEIFIPSAPHDAGTAIGAALAAYCTERRTKPPPSGATPYLGPQFDERKVLAAVKKAGLTARRSRDAAREAADMIADGNIVGWFQGRMEFGPRALGNRSLLADPRRPDTRPILNRMVKHREDFRPFAPSVLAERADEWFDVGSHLASHEYMLFACPTKAGRHERIPAVLHQDGTARIQLVRHESNPRFHELISRFFDRTGVPLVLNTSFNDSEPIVCTPAHAIATFRKAGIDALFMGDICLTSQA